MICASFASKIQMGEPAPGAHAGAYMRQCYWEQQNPQGK